MPCWSGDKMRNMPVSYLAKCSTRYLTLFYKSKDINGRIGFSVETITKYFIYAKSC